MKCKEDSIKEYYVMNTDDFVDLWRHHKKFAEQKCDYVCPEKKNSHESFLHEELQKLTDYVDWIRDRNLNENMIVTKIALFLEKDFTRREAFWWYNQKIWDENDVPDNVTMSWRTQFVSFFLRNHFSNCYRVNNIS